MINQETLWVFFFFLFALPGGDVIQKDSSVAYITRPPWTGVSLSLVKDNIWLELLQSLKRTHARHLSTTPGSKQLSECNKYCMEQNAKYHMLILK